MKDKNTNNSKNKASKMKKTVNKKNQREMIFAYILDCIDGSGYDKKLTTDADKIQFLLDTFRAEYCNEYNLKYYGSEQNTFKNWCMGLPSAFNMDFENYKIIALGQLWGLLEENATEAQESKFVDQYWDRLYMNVMQLKRKINSTLTPRFKIN